MIIEVHPEELLDREQRGELSASERELLSAHLARCVPCRLERQLRADFAREQVQPLPASDLTDVIAGALRACELPAPAPVEMVEVAAATSPGGRALWRRVAMLVAAGAVLILGVGYAGAQLGLSEGHLAALLERVGVRVAVRPRVAAPRPSAKAAVAESDVVAVPQPTPNELVEVPPVVAPQVVPSALPLGKRSVRRPARRAVAQVAVPVASAPARSETAVVSSSTNNVEPVLVPAPKSSSGVVSVSSYPTADQVGTTRVSLEAPAPLPESAGRLFERASRARHRGASQEASALYDELRARFPNSPEAQLSLAVSARMLLDQGELRAALAGFDAYLAGSHRALHEEAMVGRVRALERLGRERDARAAAEALLRAHPRSAFRAEAEALIADSD